MSDSFISRNEHAASRNAFSHFLDAFSSEGHWKCAVRVNFKIRLFRTILHNVEWTFSVELQYSIAAKINTISSRRVYARRRTDIYRWQRELIQFFFFSHTHHREQIVCMKNSANKLAEKFGQQFVARCTLHISCTYTQCTHRIVRSDLAIFAKCKFSYCCQTLSRPIMQIFYLFICKLLHTFACDKYRNMSVQNCDKHFAYYYRLTIAMTNDTEIITLNVLSLRKL